MKRLKKIKYSHILLVMSIIAIIPVIILCFYDRPSADDYSYAILTHNSIVNNRDFFDLIKVSWNNAIIFYKDWSGSFFTSIIQSLQPGIFGNRFYPIAPLFILLWMYFSIRVLIGAINRYYLKEDKLTGISLSLWFFVYLVMWLPSVTQGIFWFNGAANYMISFFAAIMNIGIYIHMYHCDHSKKKMIKYLFISCILSVLSTDGNILASFASLIISFAISFAFIIKKRYFVILPFLVCVSRFFINYFSPGIYIRQQSYGINISYFEAIKSSFIFSKNYIFSNTNLVLFVFLLTLTPYLLKIIKQYNCDKYMSIKLLVSLALSFCILSAVVCVPMYSLSGNLENCAGRIINIIWLFFILLAICNFYLVLAFMYSRKIINDFVVDYRSLILLFFLCILVIFGTDSSVYNTHSTYIRANSEIKSELASSYAKELDEREEYILKSNSKNIMVKPLFSISRLLYFSDITSDKSNWINCAVSDYYNLSSIYTGFE